MTTISMHAPLIGQQPAQGRSWLKMVGYALLAGAGLFLGLVAGVAFALASGLITVC